MSSMGKGGQCHLHVQSVLQFESCNVLEPFGTVLYIPYVDCCAQLYPTVCQPVGEMQRNNVVLLVAYSKEVPVIDKRYRPLNEAMSTVPV
jgi:hypothetical protein